MPAENWQVVTDGRRIGAAWLAGVRSLEKENTRTQPKLRKERLRQGGTGNGSHRAFGENVDRWRKQVGGEKRAMGKTSDPAEESNRGNGRCGGTAIGVGQRSDSEKQFELTETIVR